MNYYPAKTDRETGALGISTETHSINAGEIAFTFVSLLLKKLLRWFRFTAEEIAWVVAVHDIGKISPHFLYKFDEWLNINNLTKFSTLWKNIYKNIYHNSISQAAIYEYLINRKIDKEKAQIISILAGIHHGSMPVFQTSFNEETVSGIPWKKDRTALLNKITETYPITPDFPGKKKGDWWRSGKWIWLAGLIVFCDWLASDANYFPPTIPKNKKETEKIARNIISSLGFNWKSSFRKKLTFEDIFNNLPRPLQKACDIVKSPGRYIIKAPTGMGKTEAALWIAYYLISTNKSNGIYFGLPTQISSEKIHERMSTYINQMASGLVQIIHSNTWLKEKSFNGKIEMQRWFNSSKKSLLSAFGVGTIDQALLGIINSKHFQLRQFALAHKVVIIDEVHTYDAYTGELVHELIQQLQKLHCTVIILSATLTPHLIKRLVGTKTIIPPGPAIIGYAYKSQKNIICKSIRVNLSEITKIKVSFHSRRYCYDKAVYFAQKGAAVLWICDTITNALKDYDYFKSLYNGTLGLLHSRYRHEDREAIESVWISQLGPNGKRVGSILVSTQIVEQSVDIDADIIFSELAPSDMLLQRMGRLWRHRRKNRPVVRPYFIIIREEKPFNYFVKAKKRKQIRNGFGQKSYIYHPYILLRTWEVWRTLKHVHRPIDDDKILRKTYCKKSKEPKLWAAFKIDLEKRRNKNKERALQSTNIFRDQTPDEDEYIGTRLNDYPTVSIILCRERKNNLITLYDGTIIDTNEEYFYNNAQAIHKNIVKAAFFYFEDKEYAEDLFFKQYTIGATKLGFIHDDDSLFICGSKKNFYYTSEKGLYWEDL